MFGIEGPSWISNPKISSLWTLIILSIWQFGSPMIIFLAGLRQMPQDMYEAASLDGAGKWRSSGKITLPLLTPVVFFNAIIQTIEAFKSFTPAFIISGGTGNADQFDAVLHALSLPGGVRLLPHGLRLGAGLGAAVPGRLLHRLLVPDLANTGCTMTTEGSARLTVVTGKRADPPPQAAASILIAHVLLHQCIDPDALSAAVDARRVVPGRKTRSSPQPSIDYPDRASSIDAYFRGWNGLRIELRHLLRQLARHHFHACHRWRATSITCSLAAFAFARLNFKRPEVLVRHDADDAHAALPGDADPAICAVPLSSAGVNTFLPLVVPKFLAADGFFIFLMVQFFRGLPEGAGRGGPDGRLLALAHLLEASSCRSPCLFWQRLRFLPSSGPGTISSAR